MVPPALVSGLLAAAAFAAGPLLVLRLWPGAVGPFGAKLLAGLGAGVALAATAQHL